MDQLETLPLDAGGDGEVNVLLKQECSPGRGKLQFAEATPAEEALPVGAPGGEDDPDYNEALDPDYEGEGGEEEDQQMDDPIEDIEEEAPKIEALELNDAVKTKAKEKHGSKLQRKDALDEALQVEAHSVQDDADLPERNTRKEQLTKKLKDRADKEAKKKQQEEEKKRNQEEKKKNQEEKKKNQEEKKRKQEEKAAEEEKKTKEKPKKRLKQAEVATEEPKEVPSAPLTRKRSKTKMVGAEEPAAAEVPEPALPEAVVPRQKGKKRKSRASGKPKGRPRKTDVATREDPVPEAAVPKRKKPCKPKFRQFTYDKVLCQKLEEFMKKWGHEAYSKKNHDLHKLKGFNVYDKGRCGAGFKLGGARSRQIGYFGLKVSSCDSLAVNVWLAKVFYDKVHAEGLDEEWAESEAGIEYKTLLTNTAKVADANLTPDDVD